MICEDFKRIHIAHLSLFVGRNIFKVTVLKTLALVDLVWSIVVLVIAA